jgi:hypothetical protein
MFVYVPMESFKEKKNQRVVPQNLESTGLKNVHSSQMSLK